MAQFNPNNIDEISNLTIEELKVELATTEDSSRKQEIVKEIYNLTEIARVVKYSDDEAYTYLNKVFNIPK